MNMKAAKARIKRFKAEFKNGETVAIDNGPDQARGLAQIVGDPTTNGSKDTIEVMVEVMSLNVVTGDDDRDQVHVDQIRKRAVERKKVRKPLRVKLSDDEKIEAGNAMADAQAQKGIEEKEFDTVKKTYAGRIKESEQVVENQSLRIRNGFDMRQVECEVIIDYDRGLVTENRTDTGEDVMAPRELYPEETQRGLDLFPDPPEGEVSDQEVVDPAA